MRIQIRTTIAAIAVGLALSSTTGLRADEVPAAGFARVKDIVQQSAPQKAIQTVSHLPAIQPRLVDYVEHTGHPFHSGSTVHHGHGGGIPVHGIGFFDHGFNAPVKHPIRRTPVTYTRYWPGKWYGQPGSGAPASSRRLPMVYMPTDTTQLGFYYQRVPQWLPNASMIPPAPRPNDWHDRTCPSKSCPDLGAYPSGGVQPATNAPSGSKKTAPVPPLPTARRILVPVPTRY